MREYQSLVRRTDLRRVEDVTIQVLCRAIVLFHAGFLPPGP
jgi:hypothetical protein